MYRYSNGDTYEGQWLKGKKHGEGAMTFINGAKYQGGYKEDKKVCTHRCETGHVLFASSFKILIVWCVIAQLGHIHARRRLCLHGRVQERKALWARHLHVPHRRKVRGRIPGRLQGAREREGGLWLLCKCSNALTH